MGGGDTEMINLKYLVNASAMSCAFMCSNVCASELRIGAFFGPSGYTWTDYRFDVVGGTLDDFYSYASADVIQVVKFYGDPIKYYADYDFHADLSGQDFCISYKNCPTYSKIKVGVQSISFRLTSPAYFYSYSWGYESYVSFPLYVQYEATVSDGATVSISTIQSGTFQVPEPAIWAQLIVGFGLAGTAFRDRRRKSASIRGYTVAVT